MALDTAAKRWSIINRGSPWRGILPWPDGSLGQGDRQTVMFLAATPLAGEAEEVIVTPSAGAGRGVLSRGRRRREPELVPPSAYEPMPEAFLEHARRQQKLFDDAVLARAAQEALEAKRREQEVKKPEPTPPPPEAPPTPVTADGMAPLVTEVRLPKIRRPATRVSVEKVAPVLEAKPELSLEARVEQAVERGIAKAFASSRTQEDDEQDEIKLLRQLGFLN